jgi:hypothetical protein
VEQACGTRPQAPVSLAGLADLPERFDVLPADVDIVAVYMREHATVMNAMNGSDRGETEEGGQGAGEAP